MIIKEMPLVTEWMMAEYKNMSYRAIGDRLGVSHSEIHKVMSGRKAPSESMIRMMLEKCNDHRLKCSLLAAARKDAVNMIEGMDWTQ